jgi:two-component system sensor histidine kinase BaeS
MKQWVVIVQPDGVVDAVEGGAPATWVGHDLASLPNAPEDLHAIASEITRPSASYLRRWVVRTNGASIEVLLVDAVPLRKAYTNVNDLMVRLLDVFASQAKSSSVHLGVRQEGAGVALVDREKITWALATLVGNALRYARERADARVDAVFSWEDDALVVTVADNGPGMPAHRAKYLFSRDPANGASAGLALLMVHDVVAAHRGTIRVETTPGHGTTFVVRIPRVAT